MAFSKSRRLSKPSLSFLCKIRHQGPTKHLVSPEIFTKHLLPARYTGKQASKNACSEELTLLWCQAQQLNRHPGLLPRGLGGGAASRWLSGPRPCFCLHQGISGSTHFLSPYLSILASHWEATLESRPECEAWERRIRAEKTQIWESKS